MSSCFYEKHFSFNSPQYRKLRHIVTMCSKLNGSKWGHTELVPRMAGINRLTQSSTLHSWFLARHLGPHLTHWPSYFLYLLLLDSVQLNQAASPILCLQMMTAWKVSFCLVLLESLIIHLVATPGWTVLEQLFQPLPSSVLFLASQHSSMALIHQRFAITISFIKIIVIFSIYLDQKWASCRSKYSQYLKHATTRISGTCL